MNEKSLSGLIDIVALQSILKCDTLSSDAMGELSSMVKREKERKVLLAHKYKISGPFKSGNRTIYTTRAPWVSSSKKMSRTEYDDLIDALYEHYFTNPFDECTVQEMYEQMIRYYEENNLVSYLTLIHYKSDWKKYMVEKGCEWLQTPIRNVLPGQIFEHYRILTANCSMKRSTFNNLKTVVNAVFDFGINRNVGCIKASQVDTRRLRFAPVKDKWEGVYTLEDRKKILNTCEDSKPTVYTKAIELMFCLDIRIGELRALQKDDVNLEKRTINICHQMVDVQTDSVNRHSVRVDIMKGKQEAGKRVSPLSDRAVKVIEWLFESYPDTEWLLPSNGNNAPIRLHRFNDNLKRICQKAGVKYFSSHGIRFHNISAMYDAGISEKEIQRLSGHTTAMMTRHYNKSINVACEDEKIREVLG